MKDSLWLFLAVVLPAACGGSGNVPGALGSHVEAGAPEGGATVDAAVRDSVADSYISLRSDSAVSNDAGACQELNIGILGNPGANPSSDFQAWLTSAGTSVQRIQTTAPTPTLTTATLQQFDVIILDWLTRDYTVSEASAVASFVSGGGGIISMSGYDNVTEDDWHANSLLAPLSVAYTGPLLSGPVTSFAAHPITAGLTSVTFDGGYAIADLGGATSTRTPIAFLPNPADAGSVPVAFAIEMGSGHAFVWGDEWIEYDSEWSTMSEIKQLWVQIFAWVSPKNKCMLKPPP